MKKAKGNIAGQEAGKIKSIHNSKPMVHHTGSIDKQTKKANDSSKLSKI
jgi:hypothetical protein